MKLKKTLLFLLGLTIYPAQLVSCKSRTVTNDDANAEVARREMESFELELRSAQNDQVPLLAPLSYKQAEASLAQAKSSLDKRGGPKIVMQEVARGRSFLNQANQTAKISETSLEAVLAARSDALVAGAQEQNPKVFEDADDSLRKLAALIEKNDQTDQPKKQAALQAEYLALELAAIQNRELGEVRRLYNQALEEGAKVHAPRSLNQAEKALNNAEAFIVANRHQTEAIKVRVNEAKEALEHLLRVTEIAKKVERTPSENIALSIEQEQNKVLATELELDRKQRQLLEEKGTAQALMAQNQALLLENSLAQIYEAATSAFDPSEAEVYKQGEKLVIRLKGLHFPTGETRLSHVNVGLLDRVQNIIRNFGDCSVLVEGHTDARGSVKTNTKVSKERAQVVADYLIRKSGQSLNVETVGHGYQKPIATNKTAEGRAQNRRVDIVITPMNF